MIDLVKEGGHPSLTKSKPKPNAGANNDLGREGSKSVFASTGQMQMQSTGQNQMDVGSGEE